MTWLKRIGLGLVTVATIAGGALVATCGQDAECYKTQWVGSLVQGVIGAAKEGN